MDLKSKIREVADWPVSGVNFKDITTALEDKDTFKAMIDALVEPYKNQAIDKIVVIDARGFLLGTPMAYKLGCGVSLVRKKGKLPYKTIEQIYEKEYGPDTLTMHADTIKPGEKVVIVDDLLATGGTMLATIKMVEQLGAKIIGISCVVDLPFLGGRKQLKNYPYQCLVTYDN